jgi:hypothetical protein
MILFKFSENFGDKLICEMADEAVKMYTIGGFDTALIFENDGDDFAKSFPFANTLTKTVVATQSFTDDICKMLEAMGDVNEDFCQQCLFTIMCADDYMAEMIAGAAFSRDCICFASPGSGNCQHNFTEISLSECDDEGSKCNYFMEKIANYDTARRKLGSELTKSGECWRIPPVEAAGMNADGKIRLKFQRFSRLPNART